MSEDSEMETLIKLLESLKITAEQHPENQKDIQQSLKSLLLDLQNFDIVAKDIQYSIKDSPSYQLIQNKFGKVTNSVLSNVATQLSSKSGIPISRDIIRNPKFIIKWMDCYFQQLAPLLESIELASSTQNV